MSKTYKLCLISSVGRALDSQSIGCRSKFKSTGGNPLLLKFFAIKVKNL